MYKIIANGREVAQTRDYGNATGLVELLSHELQANCYMIKEKL